MIEFFNRLFGRQPSGAMAKERLRLVLMSDHLSLAPDMIESMKRDLVDVISRYVEVDREKIDVHFEHQDKALAMLANIPITGVNRSGNGKPGHPEVSSRHPEVSKDPEPVEGAGAAPAVAPRSKTAGSRKRRKKAAGAGAGQQQASGTPAPAT